MQNHALETYSPEHSDGFSENHLGVHVIIAFTKNRVTIINDASIIDNPDLVKKTKFKKTATARAIYSAITGRTDFKKANTNLGKDLGHAFVSRSKNKIVLKNRKLTLTFTRAKDGNWVTPDGNWRQSPVFPADRLYWQSIVRKMFIRIMEWNWREFPER